MRYSISNAIPHNPKSEKHPYENLVKAELMGFVKSGKLYYETMDLPEKQ